MRWIAVRAALLVAVLAAVLEAGGCAGLGGAPGTTSAGGSTGATGPAVPAAVRAAQRTHEVPTPATTETAAHPASGGRAAVEVFAARFINWTPQTVHAVLAGLARASVGQARSAMTLAAAQVAGSDGISANGISNSGTVEAVAPERRRSDRFVVVTRERTTATLTDAYDGLAPAWHVTVASVSETPGGGWVVSGWQPEN